jgi:uncharacterized protein (DUF2235 family)
MGMFEGNDEFYDTKMGSNVSFARHALAIDEQRQDFEPTVWMPRAGVDLKQVWFAGSHADVGGSCGPDKHTGLIAADAPLEWMLIEAEKPGLRAESYIKTEFTDSINAKTHKSRDHVYRFKKRLHRPLIIDDKPTKIHPSVKSRYLADDDYRPSQLKKLIEDVGWSRLNVGT